MNLDLRGYEHLVASGPFAHPGVPSFAGISFGRTSAFMAALLDPRVILCFENTGREDERTLEFGMRLEDALQRPIHWLEWRPPPRRGDPPRMFGFEVVDFRTATRSGALFEGLLQALADYRATKGLGPVVPHPVQRICTGFLKHKVQTAFMKKLGVLDDDPHDKYVGLRADEPSRVSGLKSKDTVARTYRTPLADAGITKQDVNLFWKRQPFDLGLDHDRQGNCSACFLKDYADLSRVLGEPATDAPFWIGLQKKYPGFGGVNRVSYEQLLHERPTRLMIEAALRAGREPEDDGRLEPRRFKLVVRNERSYLAGEMEAFSCACEASLEIGNDDEEDAA